jgi:hypothetical protein
MSIHERTVRRWTPRRAAAFAALKRAGSGVLVGLDMRPPLRSRAIQASDFVGGPGDPLTVVNVAEHPCGSSPPATCAGSNPGGATALCRQVICRRASRWLERAVCLVSIVPFYTDASTVPFVYISGMKVPEMPQSIGAAMPAPTFCVPTVPKWFQIRKSRGSKGHRFALRKMMILLRKRAKPQDAPDIPFRSPPYQSPIVNSKGVTLPPMIPGSCATLAHPGTTDPIWHSLTVNNGLHCEP